MKISGGDFVGAGLFLNGLPQPLDLSLRHLGSGHGGGARVVWSAPNQSPGKLCGVGLGRSLLWPEAPDATEFFG